MEICFLNLFRESLSFYKKLAHLLAQLFYSPLSWNSRNRTQYIAEK